MKNNSHRELLAIVEGAHAAGLRFAKMFNRWVGIRSQTVIEPNRTKVIAAFEDFFKVCEVHNLHAQEQLVSATIELVWSHYPEYLKKSGLKELREKFYLDHITTYKTLQAYTKVYPTWKNSEDTQNLLRLFKTKAASSRLELKKLKSSYDRNPRSWRSEIIRKLISVTQKFSQIKLTSIHRSVDDLLAAIYPYQIPPNQGGNRIRKAYGKRRKKT